MWSDHCKPRLFSQVKISSLPNSCVYLAARDKFLLALISGRSSNPATNFAKFRDPERG